MNASINSEESRPPALPAWKLALVLVGFPLLYLANSFAPWSYRLFVGLDHGYFIPFCISVVVLHWASVVVAAWLMWRAGGRLQDIGLRMRWGGFTLFLVIVVAAGCGLIILRNIDPQAAVADPQPWQIFYPWTTTDRIFAVFLYLSAGFCEEFVYRGFAIRMLQARGLKTWQAVGLSTISFVFVHGMGAFFMLPFLITVGLLLALLFLWCKRLAPGMYVHALFDMLCLLAV